MTINAALPNLNTGCNPIIPTFQLFPFANINAAAGNPWFGYTVGSQETKTIQVVCDAGTGEITQE